VVLDLLIEYPTSSFQQAMKLSEHELIAFVGGGGKTTALQFLAKELTTSKKKVTLTTTTKMLLKQLCFQGEYIISGNYLKIEETISSLTNSKKLIALGKEQISEEKIGGFPPEWIDKLWNLGKVDYLVVEADGSRGKSLKAPAHHEPQIPLESTLVVSVIGLDILNKRLTTEFVHRPELVSLICDAAPGSIITTAIISKLVVHPFGLKKGVPSKARFIPLINKIDTIRDWLVARSLALEIFRADSNIESIILSSFIQNSFSVVRRCN
jgi:probable selenium-dependent hydroxylase accessory protein YqeC